MDQIKHEMAPVITNLTPRQREIVKAGVATSKKILNLSWDYLANQPLPKIERSIVAFALFRRIEELYQGVILLSDFGEPIGGYVINRTIGETLAILTGVCTEEQFYVEYYNKNFNLKVKRIKSVIKDLDKMSFDISTQELHNLKQETEDSIDKKQATLPDAWQVFDRFNLNQLYHDTYAHCSLFTHTDPVTLNKYISVENDDIQICDNAELFKDIIITLTMASRLYFHSFEQITKHMKIENQQINENLAKLHNEFNELVAKYKASHE